MEVIAREFPPCFSGKKQYEEWCRFEEEFGTKPMRRFACRDCTVEYQQAMVRQNRCLIWTQERGNQVSVKKIAK
jgi:hypothetical protein